MVIADAAPPTRRTARLQDRGPAGEEGRYRLDIDGLRAVAIFLVVIYHVWFGRVSGGVDVFLMISAFFLTGSFARRIARDAPLRLPGFWARKFRRLLPAAAVTLVGTVAAVFLLYPPTTWPTMWRQTWASLFYVQNWALAADSVDYYARDEVLPSPLQHFWSLSIQGQVFILWPLLLLISAWVIRRFALRPVVVLSIVFGVVFVASLAFSIYETATNQQLAYFDTRTRLWEFAAGSLVAVLLPFFRAPAWLRAALGWIGLAGIVFCGMIIDVRGGFPGYLALWPVICTALVVLAGQEPARHGPSAFLSSRPLRALGRDAYALYLVHWPILITVLLVTGSTRVGFLTGAAIIVASMLLARLISWGVENPLRNWSLADRSIPVGLTVILASVLVVAAPLVAWQEGARAEAARIAAAAAAAAEDEAAAEPGVIVPVATELAAEWVSLDEPCEGRLLPADPAVAASCLQTAGAPDAGRLIIVAGDSHSEQMMGALVPLAEERGWAIVSLLKGGCTLGLDEPGKGKKAEECVPWRTAAMEYIESTRPDAVYTVATAAAVDEPGERLLAGMDRTQDRLAAAGIDLIAVRDNPRYSIDMYACLIASETAGDDCARPLATALAPSNPAAALTGERTTIVDFTPWICPDGTCVVRDGSIAVYMDRNHLTEMFARTLAPRLGEMLAEWDA